MVPTAFSTPKKEATPRETPTKETTQKSEQTLPKKDLMPDTIPEPPVKKQQTGLPSSDWGDDSKHGDASKNKKRRRKRKNEKVWPL